jgi:hypothetical protein
VLFKLVSSLTSNYVCISVLLFMGEEEAFWLLSVICEDYFSESYTLDMAGASIDSIVLEEVRLRPYSCTACSAPVASWHRRV